jgi:hypothetical protein
MVESNLMHEWSVLLGSLGMIALILLAFAIILGMEKPADAMKHGGAILGIIILLMLAPAIIASAWSAIPLWQKAALFVIVVVIWQWRRPRRRSRRREGE